MSPTLRPRSSAPARGQTLVEFALVGPLFLAFVFIIIEGGLLLNAQATLDNAAREGAREAVVCPNDQAQDFLAADCGSAVSGVVASRLGFLDTSRVSTIICAPQASDPASYSNPCASTPDSTGCTRSLQSPDMGETSGSTVEVDVYYQFDYFLGSLVGPSGPSTCVSSRARLTRQ